MALALLLNVISDANCLSVAPFVLYLLVIGVQYPRPRYVVAITRSTELR
jgi:hypothetical protein